MIDNWRAIVIAVEAGCFGIAVGVAIGRALQKAETERHRAALEAWIAGNIKITAIQTGPKPSPKNVWTQKIDWIEAPNDDDETLH